MVYAYLAKGRTQKEMWDLDIALAPTPAAKEKTIDKANMEALRTLAGDKPMAKPVPLKSRRRSG